VFLVEMIGGKVINKNKDNVYLFISKMKKELRDLVEKNKDLFWDCKRDNLSDEAIVERFLNYAELDQIKKMIKII
jgi:hypothetical protein